MSVWSFIGFSSFGNSFVNPKACRRKKNKDNMDSNNMSNNSVDDSMNMSNNSNIDKMSNIRKIVTEDGTVITIPERYIKQTYI